MLDPAVAVVELLVEVPPLGATMHKITWKSERELQHHENSAVRRFAKGYRSPGLHIQPGASAVVDPVALAEIKAAVPAVCFKATAVKADAAANADTDKK